MQIELAQPGRCRSWHAHLIAVLAMSVGGFIAVAPASAQTLERVRDAGRIRLGYLEDARPFTFRNAAGRAEGYSATLCEQIAERVKAVLSQPSLAVDWVPVTVAARMSAVEQGSVDILCAPLSETLSRRADVAFSIPVFPGGIRAVVRNDAVAGLREALEASREGGRVVWRGSPAATVLGQKSFAVVSGTTAQAWLQDRLATFQVDAEIAPVADYRTALQQLLDRDVDAFFGDRAVTLGAMDDAARANLTILPRLLTHEPYSLALPRGDEDFRLLVDRALSEIYAAPDFGETYAAWCGEFDDATRAFFLWNTLGQ